MKHFGGWALPDHEDHLIGWMQTKRQIVQGRYAYQWDKLAAATQQCRRKRVAIDVGGHVGLWSFYLASMFERVLAFEPVAEHRACFAENTKGLTNITLYPYALGEVEGTASIHTSIGSSGDSYVDGEGDIPVRVLDAEIDGAALNIDFIKADCEGFELFALKGAEQTIRRCKPVIIVEQKPGRAQKFGLPETGAVTWLESLGYATARVMSGDFIMVPA